MGAILTACAVVGILLNPVPSSYLLNSDSLQDVFDAANVPDDLREPLASIAWCESRWQPDAISPAGYRGLLQLWEGWYRYAGEDPDAWSDPVVTMRTALAVINYDREHGYPDFVQWECQP